MPRSGLLPCRRLKLSQCLGESQRLASLSPLPGEQHRGRGRGEGGSGLGAGDSRAGRAERANRSPTQTLAAPGSLLVPCPPNQPAGKEGPLLPRHGSAVITKTAHQATENRLLKFNRTDVSG